MILNRLALLSLLLVILAVCANEAFAEDVKVMDPSGLIRAMRSLQKADASVVITLSCSEFVAPQVEQTISLTNIDGLSSDIRGTQSDPCTFHFAGVKPGTWKAVQGENPQDISRVEISEGS